MTNPKTYAHTFSACKDMTGILAIGNTGDMMIGHHFLFDMKIPFAVDGSDQLIMLTGRHTVDNPVAIDPSRGLAIQTSQNFACLTWNALAAAPDGDSIKAVTATRTGPKYPGGPRPLLPIPPWLAAALMDAGTNKAADLCLIVIQAIRDFDTRAMASPAAAAALAALDHARDNAHDDEGKGEGEGNGDNPNDGPTDPDDFVLVAPPLDTAQAILWRIPVFLWAVAASKIVGCAVTLADSLPVERWCTSVRSLCFGSPFGPTTPANANEPSHLPCDAPWRQP
jgi:hypothetical protein